LFKKIIFYVEFENDLKFGFLCSRKNPVELLVVPDKEGAASGFMFWDDGDSLSKYQLKFSVKIKKSNLSPTFSTDFCVLCRHFRGGSLQRGQLQLRVGLVDEHSSLVGLPGEAGAGQGHFCRRGHQRLLRHPQRKTSPLHLRRSQQGTQQLTH